MPTRCRAGSPPDSARTVRTGIGSCVCRTVDAGTCRSMAKDLSSTKERKKLSKSSFALPGKRKYPIPDKAHARNALARVAQFGSKDEKRKVRAAVKKRFPSIGRKKKGKKSKKK